MTDHTEKDPKQVTTMTPEKETAKNSSELPDKVTKGNVDELTWEQIETIEAKNALPSGVWSSFPFDFELKWPLTRAERVQELEELLSRHYFKTIQKDNIKSAIAYHKGFPPDEVIPDDELVLFRNGKIIDESEIDKEEGMLWEEGFGGSDYMNTPQRQQPIPPGPPATGHGQHYMDLFRQTN